MNSPAASRTLAGDALADALRDTRSRTLAHLRLWQGAGLPGGVLPQHAEFNPPAWEAGHIAWFQEYWLARLPQRGLGSAAAGPLTRCPSRLADADDLYDSAAVAHARRWQLPLPLPAQLDEFLAQTLTDSLALLAQAAPTDAAQYFFRLALFHEDMHNEAAVYMANHAAHRIGLVLDAFAPAPVAGALPHPPGSLLVAAGEVTLGHDGTGFAFDNELPATAVAVAPFSISATLTTVAEYLAFVTAGGYQRPDWWTVAGWQALQADPRDLPRFHRWQGGRLERCCFGHWRALQDDEPMLHVSAHEAEAWCTFAGRRLPTEAEWMRAAATQPALAWGAAWEWTADAFLPLDGFVAHPYREYSQPWFGAHRVLKGASPATHPRLRDPRYRNFYLPARADVFCGFRTCDR